MKTAFEILAYLEAERAEAIEAHRQTQGKDAQAALIHIIKASTIESIMEWIKAQEEKPLEETKPTKRTIREKLQELKELQKRNAKRREDFKKANKK